MAILSNLSSRSGIEGPQIVLTWSEFVLANVSYTTWSGDAVISVLQSSSNTPVTSLAEEDWEIEFISPTTYKITGSSSGAFTGLSLDTLESPASCPIEIQIDSGYESMVLGDKAAFSVPSIRLLRKQLKYPEDESDGNIIYEGVILEKTAHVDIENDNMYGHGSPESNEGYYYVAYTRLYGGDWSTDATAKTTCFTWDSSPWYGFLFNKLPAVFKDKDRNETEQVILTPQSDADRDGEYSNIHEDSNTERGQLERYLRIYEMLFSRLMGGIGFYPKMFDVDDTLPEYLKLMGELVGVTYNHDLSVPRARAEIRNAVPFYKRKGTLESLEIVGRTVTGAETVEADEVIKHMLISNRLDRLSADFNNTEVMDVFEHSGDPTGFSWGGYDEVTDTPAKTYSFEVIRLFIYLTETMSFSETMYNKLARKLLEASPATTRQNVIICDALKLENNGMEDEGEDVIVTSVSYSLWSGGAVVSLIQKSSNLNSPSVQNEPWIIQFTSPTVYYISGAISGTFPGLNVGVLESPAGCPIEIRIDNTGAPMVAGDNAIFSTSVYYY